MRREPAVRVVFVIRDRLFSHLPFRASTEQTCYGVAVPSPVNRNGFQIFESPDTENVMGPGITDMLSKSRSLHEKFQSRKDLTAVDVSMGDDRSQDDLSDLSDLSMTGCTATRDPLGKRDCVVTS